MSNVFIVQHERPENDEYWEDVKLIGAFSSKGAAEAAIEQLRKQPGFRDFPDGFSVDEYALNEFAWEEGFAQGSPTSGGPKARRD